ncbi:MAG: hypothetical protein BRC25_03560 [Parcubacteria group bacterium SW_6_46_9]|nr:MAG: hypothetical protein BRC25_03560 [Parcubacteria group bacterium SW_6_46_9]
MQYRLFLSALVFLTVVNPVNAQPGEPTRGDTVTVAVSNFPPLLQERENTLNSDRDYSGYTVDLLNEIKLKTSLNFQIREYENTDAVLRAVSDEAADMGGSGITITSEREEYLDFTQPHYESGLGILTRSELPWYREVPQRIAIIFGNLKSLLATFLIFWIFAAHVLWWSEMDEQFEEGEIRDGYIPGIFDSVYFCIIVMSTVGFGDITPNNWIGRICTVILIFVGISFFGWFVSEASSALTVYKSQTQISGPNDLRGKKVATEKATTSIEALSQIGADIVRKNTFQEAFQALQAGEVQAAVFDYPVLVHYAKTKTKDNGVELVDGKFKEEYYGFVLQPDSPYREAISRAILELQRDGTLRQLHQKYF